jgi:hypothetical protein
MSRKRKGDGKGSPRKRVENGKQINVKEISMLFLYDLSEHHWKRWQSIAGSCQQLLTEQQIAVGNPGTILTDVNTLLEFVGPKGLVTKSKNASLPADRLPELNLHVSHPIELTLKRALLRDYPNLSGIFILLRVMELLQMKGRRLVVCPTALEFWRGLNSTEQYFALLEALLFQAQTSVLGGPRTKAAPQAFENIVSFLGQLSDRWRSFNRYESIYQLGPQGELPPWNLFVQQQLGLIEIRRRVYSEKEKKDWGRSGWLVGGAKLTPWGTAATWALLELQKHIYETELAADDDDAPDADQPQFIFEEVSIPAAKGTASNEDDDANDPEWDEGEAESEEISEESGAEVPFGILRPVFQPYFPEWKAIYARPGGEVRSGTHIFKVTLAGWHGGDGGIWRRIAVPPDASLDTLAGAILGAFKLDDDHLYDFSYRDRRGRSRVYNHPETDRGPFTTEMTIGKTELALKDAMHFTFDYGDYWEFDVRLEKVEAEPGRLKQPRVIESAGKAPEQYPDSEW